MAPERELTDAERRTLDAHRANPGATYRQLSEATGLAYTTVKHAAERLGLPVRRAAGVRQLSGQSAADIVDAAKRRTEELRDDLAGSIRDGMAEEAARVTRVFGLDTLARDPLTNREANSYKDTLITLVRTAGQHLDDDVLGRTNRAHVTPTIWSWDVEEAESVVTLWLTLAQRHGPAAYAVRVTLTGAELWKGGYIIGRSLVQTVVFYLQSGGFGW